jgi:hypothetical protein
MPRNAADKTLITNRTDGKGQIRDDDVAQNIRNRQSAVPDSVAKSDGYAISQKNASSSSRDSAGPISCGRQGTAYSPGCVIFRLPGDFRAILVWHIAQMGMRSAHQK